MSLPPPEKSPNLGDLAARERAAALIGTVISGRYKIVELLAMGGVGAVYLGEHVKMHKHVAIKVLHPDTQEMPDITARFEREAVAGSHVQHPNVAAATDFGELEDGTHFLVLEYVRGTTLREVIKRGPLPVSRVVSIAKQLSAALSATHAVGIVHRDLKPRNVMLIEGGRDVVKLIDFGLAKLSLKEVSDVAASRASMSDHQITGTGAIFGTIAYLAPEAAIGMDSVDARADLYALGLVLYEMLAGVHPFDIKDPVALFKHHARTPPPPIATRARGVVVPPAVEAVVMRLLAKQREDRYPSAEAVIAALDAAYDGSVTPTTSPVAEEEHVFPGPSLMPPPPDAEPRISAPRVSGPASGAGQGAAGQASASVQASASARASALERAEGASATAPSAVRDLVSEPAAPPRPAPMRWVVVAGVVGVTLAGAALLWPGGSQRDVVAGAGSAAAIAGSAMPVAATAASGLPSAAGSNATGESAARASASAAASGAASASASAAASAAATAPPASFDGAAARALFRRTVAARDFPGAVESLGALAAKDPAAFQDPSIATAARDLAGAIALTGGEGADRVFDTLGHKLGADGLDVLYEIVRLRGGSKGAQRAEAVLREPGAMDRATPALRVTFALREAPCADKPALFDRAVAEGDVRTLLLMESNVKACFGANHKPLEDATRALRVKAR